MCSIRIGEYDGEFVSLTLHGRTHLAASDYWDGNWVNCTAEAVVGAFRGRLDRSIRTDELEAFRQQIGGLYERLTGDAILASMERWIRVQVTGDGRGHFEARCRLCEDLMSGNALEFTLCFDQTYLPPLLRQLDRALESYPVVGR
jgi:hypothetical protein